MVFAEHDFGLYRVKKLLIKADSNTSYGKILRNSHLLFNFYNVGPMIVNY